MKYSLPQVAPSAVRYFFTELNIDREAFIGQLPTALQPRVFTLHGDLIRISEKNGLVWIGMTTLVEAHRGEMKSSVMRLDFAFEGLSQSEIEEFVSSCSVCGYKTGPEAAALMARGVCLSTGGVPGTVTTAASGP
jgi:hypothetical protein